MRELLGATNRLLETLTLAQRQHAIGPLQNRLQAKLATAFRAQSASFLHRFTRLSQLFEALHDDDWEPLFDAASHDTLELFTEPISDAARAAMLASGQLTIADLGIDASFGLSYPRASAWAAQHAGDAVEGINHTTRRYLHTVLTQATDDGWSYQRTAKAITSRYQQFAGGAPFQHLRSRAELIAAGEVGGAYEAGTLETARSLVDSGIDMEKRVLTAGDSRVDLPICQANADQGWIPLAAQFASGQERPLFHAGCRCTMLTRMQRPR